MSEKMNLVLTCGWDRPSHSTGGPRKVVALLIEQLRKKSPFELSAFLQTLSGMASIQNVNFEDPLPSQSYKFYKQWRGFLKQVLGKQVWQLNYYLNQSFNIRRMTKVWSRWGKDNERILVHGHELLSTLSFLKWRDPKKHFLIFTPHSKGSYPSDMSDLLGGENAWLYRWLLDQESALLKESDLVTFPSQGALQLMKKSYPSLLDNVQTRVIYNGVDLEKFSIFSKEDNDLKNEAVFTVLNVAQHVRQKRIDLLLRAIAEVYKTNSNIRLVNIGDGPLLSQNQLIAQDLGISSVVNFLGKRDNYEVIKWMQKADAFVMPSENVVFDLVTLEAMAVGIPVVVSAEGGNLECIRDGQEGILTRTGDLKSVIDAIVFLKDVRNKLVIREMVLRAKENIKENFSLNSMMGDYMKVYGEWIEKVKEKGF